MLNQIHQPNDIRSPKKVGIFILPDFAMLGFSAAVEPLRAANRLAGRKLYDWTILSLDGNPVRASIGIEITPHCAVFDAPTDFDLVIICAGISRPADTKSKKLLGWVRRLASRGCIMGAISTGSEVLANAGLLDGYRCTIHWENDESFRENHPDAMLTGGIFEIDRNRITAAGGTASLDMMLNWIALAHDEYLASAIAEQFIHAHQRSPGEYQRTVELKLARRRSPKLAKAIELMMSRIENPVPVDEIARAVDLSIRQLERLFAKYRARTLHRYYLDIRLQKARNLVLHSDLSLHQISLATGFSSQAHFSRCYKNLYGVTPSKDRATGETSPPIQLPVALMPKRQYQKQQGQQMSGRNRLE